MNPLVNPKTQSAWRPLFLRVLRNSFTLREAAERIGITSLMVRSAMRDDPEFAELVNQAMEDATALLEAEAHRRAMEGSDLLLIFILKARNPNKYRDKPTEVNNKTINLKTYVGFSPDEWDSIQPSGA